MFFKNYLLKGKLTGKQKTTNDVSVGLCEFFGFYFFQVVFLNL